MTLQILKFVQLFVKILNFVNFICWLFLLFWKNKFSKWMYWLLTVINLCPVSHKWHLDKQTDSDKMPRKVTHGKTHRLNISNQQAHSDKVSLPQLPSAMITLTYGRHRLSAGYISWEPVCFEKETSLHDPPYVHWVIYFFVLCSSV